MLFGKRASPASRQRMESRLLHVHCPLQTCSITQPPVRYIHTAVPFRCTQFRTTTPQSPHCSVPAAECLHSSIVGLTAQTAHAADQLISHREGSRCGLSPNHFGQFCLSSFRTAGHFVLATFVKCRKYKWQCQKNDT